MNWRAAWPAFQRWYAGHSQRDRRIILGVAIAIGAAVLLVTVIDPLRAYRRRVAEEVADGQDRLERSARFAGAIDHLRLEREDLKKRLAQANSRLLPGDSGTLGAAALQERANTLAAEKNISVLSTQVMKEEQADPFRKVAVRLTLSGELRPFAEFVSGLEYGPQQLTIPFVEVSRRGAVPGAKGPRILSATVEVSGYLRAAGQEKEKPAEAGEGEGEGPVPEAAPAGGEAVAPGAPEAGAPGATPPPAAPPPGTRASEAAAPAGTERAPGPSAAPAPPVAPGAAGQPAMLGAAKPEAAPGAAPAPSPPVTVPPSLTPPSTAPSAAPPVPVAPPATVPPPAPAIPPAAAPGKP